jgi:hypothetical protein
LQESLTRQRLHYYLSKEVKRREKTRPAPVLPAVVVARNIIDVDGEDNATSATEISPLTTATIDGSTTTSSKSSSSASQLPSVSPCQTVGRRPRRRSRKSSRQASEARLDDKMRREEVRRQYSLAFKEATMMLSERRCTAKKLSISNRETADQMILRLNEKHRLLPTREGTRKLVKSTLYKAIARGNAGKSPLKKGPTVRIPSALLEAVAVHAEVSQVSTDGELRGKDIKRLLGAATIGTKFEHQFTTESAWRKLRRDFPEKLQAAKKVSVDDARAQWTTHQNLQQWFDDAKQDLIQTGLCIDQEVRDTKGNLVSELDFRSDEVKRRIINMDETHHDLSVTGDRGGPRSVMYHNPNLQRGSKRGVKSSRHVTGVYATSAGGESLPPMYIFDSGAKIEDNFRVKIKWLEGLPTVTGRYGCPSIYRIVQLLCS